jgi:hypothetical protein
LLAGMLMSMCLFSEIGIHATKPRNEYAGYYYSITRDADRDADADAGGGRKSRLSTPAQVQ